jgi:hypothetical protein
LFLRDIQKQIHDLQQQGHAIVHMLDANATIQSDSAFSDFIAECSLIDLHLSDPAPSTYIGYDSRRIDFIIGCPMVHKHMLRSSTLAYHPGPQSDHQSLFVDLNLDFLHIPSDGILPTVSRALHTGNPELVEAYNKSLLQYYSDHKMVDRIDALYATYKPCPERKSGRHVYDGTTTVAAQWLWARSVYHSHRRSVHGLLSCAILQKHVSIGNRLRESEQGSDYSTTLHRWQKQIQVHDATFAFPHIDVSLSVDRIRSEFSKASAAFRHCQKEAGPMCMKTYEDHTNSATVLDSRRKAKIVRNTIDGEVLRTKFRDIRRIVKPSSCSSLSKILIPRRRDAQELPSSTDIYQLLQTTDSEDLVWETVVERDQLERHLLDHNRESFRAVSASPCGHGLIHDSITFSSLPLHLLTARR